MPNDKNTNERLFSKLMKVFKFGGASIKDANGVRNVASVLQKVGYNDVFLVISAMGKMTNAFEKLTQAYCNNSNELEIVFSEIQEYHFAIINDLFKEKTTVLTKINTLFSEIEAFFNKNTSNDYDYIYDQTVSKAELISTTIISEYLQSVAIKNTWLDVRDFVKTNSDFRDAKVDWQQTETQISSIKIDGSLYITQGFLGQDKKGNTTTLGREGSDYTAGIFAYSLNAENVTIWKDVDGVLNADPRYFKETALLEQISYEEAIELAFYGASVIHPKTLQPLQRKEIPLYVKSFVNPEKLGTTVTKGHKIVPELPCFIVKKNQILLSIATRDFSFVVEQNISEIFSLLHQYKMKVNLIQNSAISFSVCLDDKYENFEKLLNRLTEKFTAKFYKNVSLYTIRHFNENAVQKIEKGNKVLLKQLNLETVQVVIE